MTLPDPPEVIGSGQGPRPRWFPRGPRRRSPRWVRSRWPRATLTLAGVAAALWWLLQQPGSRPPTPPTQAPAPVTQATQQFVQVVEICPPATDGRHALVVSFILRNISAVPVTVRSVQPLLPLGGLDAVATDISGGTCAATSGAPAGLDLAAGGDLVVSFRFLLPGTCPAALPIQARTEVLVSPVLPGDTVTAATARVVGDDAPVFNDLGSIRFSTCPATAS